MTGTSKILTVSYGTFTCRLEGYDDPLETVRAIAAYFRDLAADDRYFGAEPPTPDADALHHMADRAVNRPVEAGPLDRPMIPHMDKGMHDPDFPASDLMPPAPLPGPEAEPQPAATGLLADEGVAARLQHIRAAAARRDGPADGPVPADADGSAPASLAAAALSAGTDTDSPAEVLPVPDHGWGSADDAAGLRGFAEPPDLPIPPEDAGGVRGLPPALPPASAADDVTELVAAVPDAALPAGATEPPAEVAVPFFGHAADHADTLPEALPDLTAEDLPESAVGDDDAPPAPQLWALPELDAPPAEDAAAPSGPVPDPEGDTESSEGDSESVPFDLWYARAFPDAANEAHEAFADLPDAAEPEAHWPPDPDLPEPALATAEPSATPIAPAMPPQEVLLLRAADPFAGSGGAAPDRLAPAPSGSGDEADTTWKATGPASPDDYARDAEDLTRLLRQTDTELDKPQSDLRLLTMPHLKAVVATTVANLGSAGDDARQAETAAAVDRHDAELARVATLLRPAPRPSGWPAPLVLVSEQRIDRPAPDRAADRRAERQIGRMDLAGGETPDDSAPPARAGSKRTLTFAEFAGQLGASTVADLVEAAAAYTACIEERPHFTRPDLMRYVATAIGTGDAQREDSMRSFGTLLRQGRITKTERGQFGITDSSQYLAEARRMTR